MTIKKDFVEKFGDFDSKFKTKIISGIYLERYKYDNSIQQIVVDNRRFYSIDDFDDEMKYCGDSLKKPHLDGYKESVKSINKLEFFCEIIRIEKLEKQIEQDLKNVTSNKKTILKF